MQFISSKSYKKCHLDNTHSGISFRNEVDWILDIMSEYANAVVSILMCQCDLFPFVFLSTHRQARTTFTNATTILKVLIRKYKISH